MNNPELVESSARSIAQGITGERRKNISCSQ